MRKRVSIVATGMFGIACFLLGVTWARNWSAALVGIGVFVGTLLLCAIEVRAGRAEQERRLGLVHAHEMAVVRRAFMEERKARMSEARSRDSVVAALGGDDDATT